MIDINLLKTNPDHIKEVVKQKNSSVDIDMVLDLMNKRSALLVKVEELRKSRNDVADEVKKAAAVGKPPQELIDKGKKVKEELDPLEVEFAKVSEEFIKLAELIPNPPSADTPVGKDESENKVLRTVGDKPIFTFKPKEHHELGEALGVIDSETAGKVSGTRFTYIKGKLALLQFALIQHTLKVVTNQEILEKIITDNNLKVKATPFIPVIPPVMIRPEVFQRMARLEPKEERYHIPSDDVYLIGSAEHTLGPLHMDEVVEEKMLPLRYVGYSTAFRREAGSYGKDTKGILRLHQFDKVELESFSLPEDSIEEQNFFVAVQEHLTQSLGIPYQIIITCTGDMGDPDARHLDLEMWMPGQNVYRETHSADLMTDYQARRLNTRVKRSSGENQFVHTNDATAFAVGRTLIAIIENYQQEDGSIMVPEVLVPYTGFTQMNAE